MSTGMSASLNFSTGVYASGTAKTSVTSGSALRSAQNVVKKSSLVQCCGVISSLQGRSRGASMWGSQYVDHCKRHCLRLGEEFL
eukprot:16672-Heterococcus_DN1.PRE.2